MAQQVQYKIADFGISKELKDLESITKTKVGSMNTMGRILILSFFF